MRFRRRGLAINCVLVVAIWVLSAGLIVRIVFIGVLLVVVGWIFFSITRLLNVYFGIPGRSQVTHRDCRPRWPPTWGLMVPFAATHSSPGLVVTGGALAA